MRITKIFLNSMLIMYKRNKLPTDRIQLMRQEVFERDIDSCKFCKNTKGDEGCDRCCNNFETFFTPNKLFTGIWALEELRYFVNGRRLHKLLCE